MFFYCNHGNPLDESLNRILLGVSRISQVGPQLFFGKKLPKFPDQYPVWSRCITHDFEKQGFRLPYHEYLKAGHDTQNILCLVPEGATLNFSYVAEHVGDDLAVGALERLLQSVQAVKDDDKVQGEWDRHLVWLNDLISEVWQDRGAFPGIGSVLQYLGCESGTAFQREVLLPLFNKGDNAWQFVTAIFEGRRKCEQKQYAKALKQAGERWMAYKEPRRRLLSMLVRLELSPLQVERVANPDNRLTSGISASDEQLVANPYLLSEMDQGDDIMHGMQMQTAGMHNQVRLWASQGHLQHLLDRLQQEGFAIYLTADHGNVTATGIGNPREGVLVETRGKRARVYDRLEFRDEVKAKFPDSIPWPNYGLPPARHVLLAGDLKAFTNEGDRVVAHGGITLEEVMVPFVTISRECQ